MYHCYVKASGCFKTYLSLIFSHWSFQCSKGFGHRKPEIYSLPLKIYICSHYDDPPVAGLCFYALLYKVISTDIVIWVGDLTTKRILNFRAYQRIQIATKRIQNARTNLLISSFCLSLYGLVIAGHLFHWLCIMFWQGFYARCHSLHNWTIGSRHYERDGGKEGWNKM